MLSDLRCVAVAVAVAGVERTRYAKPWGGSSLTSERGILYHDAVKKRKKKGEKEKKPTTEIPS